MGEEKTVALVTGVNKGIGYEIAAGLGRIGWSVGVGARDEQRREQAAATQLQERFGRLDVLVNNAGITGGAGQLPTEGDLDAVRAALDVNVFGVIRTTDAMLPLLRRSASPRIVNMSSSVGSLTYQSAGRDKVGPVSLSYSPSKTYLNAITLQYVRELADTNIKINLGCPGYVATDLNGLRGFRTPSQGAAIAIKLATLPDDGPSGGYFDDEGPIPW